MSRSFLSAVLTGAIVVLFVSDSARAEGRRALMIANANYREAEAPLSTNADSIEGLLNQAGFRVRRYENLDSEKQKQAAEEFANLVPTNGVALFYFSGFGATVDRLGKSYPMLRPVRASIKNEGDYRKYGLNVLDVIESLQERSGSRLNLVVVDVPAESAYGYLGHRTTANFYTTLLHLAGDERDRFGMADPNLKDLDQTGPLAEWLA